ncbi:MAG TPA: cyclic nucleotide-binding domain-containing protein [Vicinamibacteria bacterium]|nr:cyclic nucleotide-binding domain-containing protein [Vicinamibacteria bacterium]
MSEASPGSVTEPGRWQQRTRFVLVLGYVGLVVAGFLYDWQPRVFWTMLLPFLPVSIVLMGFSNWRRVCPLAYFGDIGRRLNRRSQRRVPDWLERWFFVVTFGVLLAMLVLRLVATNGDGRLLGVLLVALALAAALTNTVFTGKTWCNFVCPVGLIERIYTEPGSLIRSSSNSQCERCTACKKHCPDIDQENGYWQDLMTEGRRLATFAFPGLVLAFYTYYWLRHGSWEAYFDGRWTRVAIDSNLLLGPGFFFIDGIPAIVAASLTLLVFSAASYGIFRLVESALGRLASDAERKRHLALALAAFTAFVVFFFFAGAPTLRKLPGGTRAVAFITPAVATLFLTKRWRRRREHYIRERGATKLLRNWPFDNPPPQEPDEVYAWIKADEHAREKHLAAYASTVQEIIADGLVRGGELRFLEEVRKQFGISAREHERVVARLSADERELFARADSTSLEQRVQLAGYQTALSEALLRRAPDREIEELREAFGVSRQDHDSTLEKIRGEAGPLRRRVARQVELAVVMHRDLATLGRDGSVARRFLAGLLLQAQDAAVRRAMEFLALMGDKARVEALRPRIVSDDRETRQSAVESLSRERAEYEDLVRALEAAIVERIPESAPDPVALTELLERHASSADPYVRAAAIWTATKELGIGAGPILARAIEDPNELVNETAVAGARHILEVAEAEALASEGETALARASVGLAQAMQRRPVAAGLQSQTVKGETSVALAQLWRAIESVSESSFSKLPTIERMQFLRLVPLFSGLDSEDLYDLSLVAQQETFVAPQVLCKEGDPEADDLFIVVGGRASVVVASKDDSSEDEHEVEVLDCGAVVGELSLLDGGPRSATVRPKDGPLQVLRIPGSYFRARLLLRQRVTSPLLANLTRIIRRMLLRAAGERRFGS